MPRSLDNCPQCLSTTTLRRSRRRFFDWPAKVFGYRAARCTACGLRFYHRKFTRLRSNSFAAQ